jgi:hypothetical protein
LLSAASRIRVARAALLVGASIALAAIAVPVLDHGRPNESHFNSLNILGLLPIRQMFGHPTITYQLLIGAAIVAILGVLISTKAWIFGLLTVAVLASSSIYIHVRYLDPGSAGSARENALADAVHELQDHGVSAKCIVLDHESRTYSYWNEYNYRFLLPSSRFEITRGNEAVNCGPLVITSDPDYGVAHTEMRLVSVENDAPMSLWIDLARLAPRSRNELTNAGLFFPSSPCGPLPEDAYKARLSATVSRSAADPVDLESVELDLDVGHIGRGAPWLGSRASNGCGRVRIAVSVSDERGDVVYRNSIGLPRTLFPGQGVHVHAKVATLAPVPTLSAAHRYKLLVRLEQVGVRFFRGKHRLEKSLSS